MEFTPTWEMTQSPHLFENSLVIYERHASGYKGHIVAVLEDPAKFKKCKNFTPEQQLANARLITAAPKLLEFARNVQRILKSDSMNYGGNKEIFLQEAGDLIAQIIGKEGR